VRLEHSPLDPADLDLEDACADEMPDLADCIERHQPGPVNEVGRWAHQFLPPSGSIGTLELLTRVSQGIWGRAVPLVAAAKDTSEEPEPGEGVDASPLD